MFIPDLIPTKHNLTFESQKRTKPTENGWATELLQPELSDKKDCGNITVIISLSAFDLQYFIWEVKYEVLCVINVHIVLIFQNPNFLIGLRSFIQVVSSSCAMQNFGQSRVLTARQQSGSCSKERAKRRWCKFSAHLPDVTHHSLFTFKADEYEHYCHFQSFLVNFIFICSFCQQDISFHLLNFMPEPPKHQ